MITYRLNNHPYRIAKPCPFCGSARLGVGRSTEDREGFPVFVFCFECSARGPFTYTRDKALWECTDLCAEKTGWNNRAEVLTIKDPPLCPYPDPHPTRASK